MVYAFGVFEFDAETAELRRSGGPVRLEPQPARALGRLLSRAGEIVTREQLINHVWGNDTNVDFNRGLAYCIAEIRRALGDSAENPRFVQTLPKRGFRFIAPVASVPRQDAAAEPASGPLALSQSAARRWRSAAVALAATLAVAIGLWAVGGRGGRSRPVVAVSVFDNETGDSRYDLPVRAVSDTVVDRLTKLGPHRIGVVGNRAVLRMPRSERDLNAIADETGAAFVILAQLQNKDPDLSLLIHLIRLDDGTHVWTHRIGWPKGEPVAGLDDQAAQAIEAAAGRFVIHDFDAPQPHP